MTLRGLGVELETDRTFPRSLESFASLEAAGADALWVPEAYGYDAASQLGALSARTGTATLGTAVIPVQGRAPALIAMTATTLDALSGGRFALGLGASGPGVVEGFYGVPFDAPVSRMRDTIAVCRKVWLREGPLRHDGPAIAIPLAGSDAQPVKPMVRPLRSSIPIWVGALGRRMVELTAEVADGWLTTMYAPEKAAEVWGDSLQRGSERRDPARGPLRIAAGGIAAIGDDDELGPAREQARTWLGRLIGAMGTERRNAYRDVAGAYGHAAAAERIGRAYRDGGIAAAGAAVPEDLVDAMTLIGTPERVVSRLAAYAAAGVTDLKIAPVATASHDAASVVRTLRAALPVVSP